MERRREMDEIRTEWLMTLPRITEFLAALEINLPSDIITWFLLVFTATKNSLFREQ